VDFWFEFLDVHMNEKTTIFHDFHGFKWYNINIYLILTFFFGGSTPFLVCYIVTSPIEAITFNIWTFLLNIILQNYKNWI